jgi:hypothetical protein
MIPPGRTKSRRFDRMIGREKTRRLLHPGSVCLPSNLHFGESPVFVGESLPDLFRSSDGFAEVECQLTLRCVFILLTPLPDNISRAIMLLRN